MLRLHVINNQHEEAAIKEESYEDHPPNYLRPPRSYKGQQVTHHIPQPSWERWGNMKPIMKSIKKASSKEDYLPRDQHLYDWGRQ